MNLPNKLTLIRIAFVPLFMLCFLLSFPYNRLAAAIIFTIAAITDGLDGYIARKYNMITNLGKFLDPLADKLLITAGLVCLVDAGEITSLIAVIIISREFAVTGLRIIAANKGIVIAASKLGKYKTVSQIIAALWAILQYPYYNWLMWIAVALTIISGVDYFYNGRNLLFEEFKEKSN